MGSMASPDLQWQLLRKTSSFLLRQRGTKKTFTREPFNLKGVNSFRYNGLIKRKAISIEGAPKGKGIVLAYKKTKVTGQKPQKSVAREVLARDARRNLKSIGTFMKSRNYQKAHLKLALRRASQLLKSQKPTVSRKARKSRKKKAE